MKLTKEQYNEFREKIASEIAEYVGGEEAPVQAEPEVVPQMVAPQMVAPQMVAPQMVAPQMVEDPLPMQDVAATLTDEQIEAIIAAKEREIMERQMADQAAAQGAEQAEAEAQAMQGQEGQLSEEELAALAQIEAKAAATYEYALNKIALAEDMYVKGSVQRDAAIEVLAEYGILDENGINKEAAEQDENYAMFTNRVASSHQDALEKIAAATECYNESHVELKAAMEVLAEFGYAFE